MSNLQSPTIRKGLLVIFFFATLFGYFINIPEAKKITSGALEWGTVITTFGLGVAFITLLNRNIRNVARYKKSRGDAFYSIALLLTVVVYFICGFLPPFTKNAYFVWLYNNFNVLITALFASLVGFTITTASYRALRVRTLEASILLIVGLLVILGNAPIGEYIWPGFPLLNAWFLNVASSGAFRGLLLSSSIGFVGMTIRMLLGLEKLGE
jgi:hypothetical protein